MPPADALARLEELLARIEELERRISALERLRQTPPETRRTPQPSAVPSARPGEAPPLPQPLSVFSVFGHAVLGIAGAYMLRALAESRAIPPWLGVALGVACAAGWLVWSARPRVKAGLARSVYAATAAVILAPMLWEVTVRFRILEPPVTAAVLAAFALLAMTLGWRSHAATVVWVGACAAAVTALGLMAAARAPLPFAWALLGVALASEILGLQGRWPGIRLLTAAAADIAVLITLAILGDAAAIPPEYQPAGEVQLIALGCTLFAVSSVGLAARSLVFRLRITVAEALQFAVAILLAGWGVIRVTQGVGAAVLGGFCLAAAVLCYGAAFGLLSEEAARRNFYIYCSWALVLGVAGSFLALPAGALVVLLCFAALSATALGVRALRPVLVLHGLAYLACAVAASGLLGYAGRALAGTLPATPGRLPLLAASVALVCSALMLRFPGEQPSARLLRLLPMALAVYAAAALAVAALVLLFWRGAPVALAQLAVVRTVVTGAAALLLAFGGARFSRLELVWMAYAAAGLGSLKLLVEDLQLGSTWALAASLLVYGAVLMAIPLLVRGRTRTD